MVEKLYCFIFFFSFFLFFVFLFISFLGDGRKGGTAKHQLNKSASPDVPNSVLISQTDIGCNNSSTSAPVSQSEDDPTGVLVSKANIGVKNTSTSLNGTEFNLGFPFELKTRLGEMVFNLEGVLRSQKYVFF